MISLNTKCYADEYGNDGTILAMKEFLCKDSITHGLLVAPPLMALSDALDTLARGIKMPERHQWRSYQQPVNEQTRC